MSLASLNQRFILLVFVVSSFFFSSYTITEGPLISNTVIGNSGIINIDEQYIYTYRENNSGVYFFIYDKNSLSLSQQKSFEWKSLKKDYGKVNNIYFSYDKMEIRIVISVSGAHWEELKYKSVFNLDDFLNRDKGFEFEKYDEYKELLNRGFVNPDIKEGFEWTLFRTNENESEFFGYKIGEESEVVYVKTESSTGKVLEKFDILIDKDFSEKYFNLLQGNKVNLSLDIVKSVVSDDNSVYVCAATKRAANYNVSSSYASDMGVYSDYDEVWIYKFNMGKGFLWSSVFPIGQTVINSFYHQRSSDFYSSYGLFGVLESDNSLTVLFNCSKRNIAKFDNFTASTKLELFQINTADNGVLMGVTVDKKSGKWSHEMIYDNDKNHSYINATGGYAFNGAYYMLVDMPKKNKTGLYKFSL